VISETEQAIEWNNKGYSLFNLGRFDKALPYFDDLLKHKKEYLKIE
jgi:tetratricopeptide (TPR) repeat protein